jgi:putative oxidoreductase
MNPFTDIYAPLLGRILVGGFFLWEGIEKAINFPSTVALLGGRLPHPIEIAAVAIAVEVIGGLALIVGLRTKLTALVLAVFMILSAFLYLDFSSETQVTLFLQSMAIVGGLLYISAFGSGSWAPDWIYKRKR